MSRKYTRSGQKDPSWLAEWRRKKANGQLPAGPVAHLRYGKFSRPVARSLDLVRPPLSNLDSAELERLEAKHEAG